MSLERADPESSVTALRVGPVMHGGLRPIPRQGLRRPVRGYLKDRNRKLDVEMLGPAQDRDGGRPTDGPRRNSPDSARRLVAGSH